jgi:hypothetical protein
VMAAPSDGRVGDVWRVVGADHEMRVTRLSEYAISVNSVSRPQPSGWGYELDNWENVLYRIREDLATVSVGDIIQMYVPPTDVYLLRVHLDERRPALSGWFGYQAGRQPTPDIPDTGLFFHPAADESITVSLQVRPYAMLEPGALFVDGAGAHWEFQPPFRFTDSTGTQGIPQWPLTVSGDADATAALNGTSHAEQVSTWELRSGVTPEVFELKWPEDD